MEISADECISVLECAIGEADSVIPDDVLQSTIGYIKEYKRLRYEMSWIECPEISEPKREFDVGGI